MPRKKPKKKPRKAAWELEEERARLIAQNLDEGEIETLEAYIQEDFGPGVDAPSRYMEDVGVIEPGGWVTEFGHLVAGQVHELPARDRNPVEQLKASLMPPR